MKSMDGTSQDVARRFGRELARLREMADMTQARLANDLEISSSHLSNLERGYRTPKGPIIAQLDKTLSADGHLVRLWEELTGSGRSVWLDELAELERDAITIMESQTVMFPALLQTEKYARVAVSTLSPWMTRDEVAVSVRNRMERVERFTESQAPIHWAVIDHSVITRKMGPDDLHRAQLSHVANLIECERVSVQVVEGRHAGLAGPFKIISPPGASDVVYAESAHSGQVIDTPEDVRRFRLLYGAVQAVALSPDESARLILKTLEGLGDG
ncbi:transcriptional regulator with XRE-family HTH domain [Lipingzhangella halophila]|uniref:Transcriptional regulator with XRE-family HTH domain n=1 Tax=Lipingzhangella halophila TaxID=1783352 RepID=A0A7W7RMP5_9ACTN|nr:helix-turn-helix transcriptional regulator [Lipingzhangella halophila]MBB4934835.1 transcriptional regulator with XRE-family HTH domain [Lipingzhangella halophila]